ncbi:DUF1684 domain-containing protein [Martelella alba]|uniref:DUF1684 domain-containing protein n=1 Tax=Martelella alba TaxID=2590451 RepID=A0A506U2S4_9HYPH|nr:DUF1684 domain-containing protein [Martelella alba]TPW26879.1 DUF1684 domain-containing protein [Martelella alba]
MTEIENYPDAIENWRRDRHRTLMSAGGWLSLIGRWWLEPGTVTVGSSSDCDIVLAVGPAHAGSLELSSGEGLTFRDAGGDVEQTIGLDSHFPVMFRVDRFTFEITSMDGALALRIRDMNSDEPAKLQPIPHYPTDPAWRIRAEWVALERPDEIMLDTVVGVQTKVGVTHLARFAYQGRTVELLSTYGTAERPQFVFRDITAKDETYPPARFVFGEDVSETAVTLDFNKAINPPCAFTEYAACPLPPAQNILPFAIRAGEKRVHE